MIARTTRTLVRLYQYTLGLVLPNSCRFEPTCSEYALQAVEKHGALGLWLALRRILRCHPWGGFGYDPVPPRTGKVRSQNAEIRMQNCRAPELRIASGAGHTEGE